MSEEKTDVQVQESGKQEIVPGRAERTRERAAFIPRVDIYEDDERIVILADMPGVDVGSVDITLEDNVVDIDGCVEPDEPEDYRLAYAEYRTGDYRRSFSLSEQVDEENIEATVKNGVLRLDLPKAKPVTRKVTVKAG